MILIYDHDTDIEIGETMTIEWKDGPTDSYQVVMVKTVDDHCEVEVREV